METLVVNLFGAPGTGKTSTMAHLFSKLKWAGIEAEMVTEYAKDLVWEKRGETFKDELYIFAKQNHRLFRVNGQVQVIVTDRPLPLTILYSRQNDDTYSENLEAMVMETFDKYENYNIYLKRTKAYDPIGRNQTEQEADQLASEFLGILDEFDIPYIDMEATQSTAATIFMGIQLKLEEMSK